jgi:hypothetical protein
MGGRAWSVIDILRPRSGAGVEHIIVASDNTNPRRGTTMEDGFRKAALDYHRLPRPGKISIAPTKGLTNQRDLALA